MAVSHPTIPSSLRAPLFYAEVDQSAANSGGADVLRTLLVGQRLATGAVAAGVLTRIASVSDAIDAFGRGSMLHRMAIAYFAGDALGEVWAVALDDDGAATAETIDIVVSAVATEAGTLPLYVCGVKIAVAIDAGLTKAATAAAITAAFASFPDLPVTAADDGVDTVTLTARNKGTIGNAIDVRTAYLGSAGGEKLPTDMVLAIAHSLTGATDPGVATAIAAMADEEFEFIVWPYVDTTALNLLQTEMSGALGGRWGAARRLFGHAFGFKDASAANLTSFGNARNDPAISVGGLESCPTYAPEVAAAFAAAAANSIRVDPARPLQTLELVGVLAPAVADRFTLAERNTLLFDGVATFTISRDGKVRIERAITTYQLNGSGSPDDSFLDSTTRFTLAHILRSLEARITSKYGRHKIVNNGTRIKAGQAAISPNGIRAELIAHYAELEADGLVENADAFATYLVVERNSSNPTRIDVLYPPDLVNGLRLFALLNQFRLQYPTA